MKIELVLLEDSIYVWLLDNSVLQCHYFEEVVGRIRDNERILLNMIIFISIHKIIA